jgi:hypothetical protein
MAKKPQQSVKAFGTEYSMPKAKNPVPPSQRRDFSASTYGTGSRLASASASNYKQQAASGVPLWNNEEAISEMNKKKKSSASKKKK